MKQELSTAARYKAAQTEAEIVDVTPPSGFVFKFKKPNRLHLLFKMDALPQSAASTALESWKESGAIEAGDRAGAADTVQLVKTVFALRDAVLELSYSPKIVQGKADESKDEISSDDIAGDDLAYFMAWVQEGGDASKLLVTFPEGRGQDAPAGPNRKERRTTAKRAGRASG